MTAVNGKSQGVRISTRLFLTARNDRGVALMIVLWVMALLMIIVSEFAYTMKVESAAVKNFKDEAEAYYLASAGINMALDEISKSYDLVCLDGNGSLVFRKKESGILRDIEARRDVDLGGGRVFYVISDEQGKININTASRETISDLLRITGVEVTERDVIADSILDWVSAGHLQRMNGAKTDYYSALPHPYASKDGLMDTVEELLLVRGMTPEIFYGTGKVPPEFNHLAGKSGDDHNGIATYLTVKGDGKLNINTADEVVLEAVLGKGKAQEIMLRRSTEGFFRMPAYGGTVTSGIFSINSTGEVNGARVGIKAVAERAKDSAVVRVRYWKEEG